jgi:nicotinate-nucleotide adenylyltransferase
VFRVFHSAGAGTLKSSATDGLNEWESALTNRPAWLPREVKTLLVYGGTFDPVHIAHVVLPEMVRQEIGADLIAYIPAGTPPHKQGIGRTPGRQRLEMLKLALEDNPNAVVLTHELDRETGKPSYTVDTLETLRQELGPEVKLRLLMGGDMLAIFPKWHRYQRILELAEPVVMVRPPVDKEAMLKALPAPLEAKDWAARVVTMAPTALSSTTVRERLKQAQGIDDLVPEKVSAYIRQHGLYGAAKQSP